MECLRKHFHYEYEYQLHYGTIQIVHIYARHVSTKNTYSYMHIIIPGVPEKAERRIFSTLRAESVIYFLHH